MSEPFELEWLGGPAERHFRRARPETHDLPWGTIDVSEYPPSLVDAARRTWTQVAINEYRAVVAFSQVVGAMALARAPLDLVGMASDFLADECLHVELASRVTSELGGGATILVDMRKFVPERRTGLSPLQLANELVLEVSCVAEAFSGGTALANQRVAAHPLTRAVFDTILRDEARHRRLGALYFDWARESIDDAERARLADVAVRALDSISVLWRFRPSVVVDGVTEQGWRIEDIHALGWLESSKMAPLAREVVRTEILEPLDRLGIVVPAADRQRLLA
ncbi:MAG TPA: hypothetical protein VEK07_23480 [Polyangiaceae bacterium]|nr:hypothetical protein [Polyangiaceae bacterium]